VHAAGRSRRACVGRCPRACVGTEPLHPVLRLKVGRRWTTEIHRLTLESLPFLEQEEKTLRHVDRKLTKSNKMSSPGKLEEGNEVNVDRDPLPRQAISHDMSSETRLFHFTNNTVGKEPHFLLFRGLQRHNILRLQNEIAKINKATWEHKAAPTTTGPQSPPAAGGQMDCGLHLTTKAENLTLLLRQYSMALPPRPTHTHKFYQHVAPNNLVQLMLSATISTGQRSFR